MWTVWLVIGLAVAIFAATTMFLWPDLRAAPLGWQLLGASGLPLALGGLGFAIRFWDPTPGPYLANELYPFGTLLNAWAVSFGFMWLAFGLAFFALAVRGRQSGRTWLALLVAWVFAWLPHGVIGIAFAVAGSNQPSIEFYREWGSESRGFLILVGSGAIVLCHLVLSVLGFALSGLDLHRRPGPVASPSPRRSA
jgi:hypothetical protein